MTLVKWSPIRELESMRRDMDRIFEDVFDGRSRPWLMRRAETGVIVPRVDMYDRKDEVVVKAELPGVKKEDVDITITKDSLTLRGEIKKVEDAKEDSYYCSECTYGSFVRTIPLPVEINASKAKANFKDGILEITLPKLEEAKTKEVKVKVE